MTISPFATSAVSPILLARLRTMPKAEIHVHLEGASDAATVWQMALDKIKLIVYE
jgi:adenosine deaminase